MTNGKYKSWLYFYIIFLKLFNGETFKSGAFNTYFEILTKHMNVTNLKKIIII